MMIKKPVFVGVMLSMLCLPLGVQSQNVAYDIDMAKEICSKLPLENVEGIWLYPEDKVTVMILNNKTTDINTFPSYTISVVTTADARLHPGEIIGTLSATAQEDVYKIELATERKNDLLLKPKTCLAKISKDSDTFIFKKQKAPFKGRLNFNFNRLLPGFWKIISTGISSSAGSNSLQTPAGMIKLYPSYDGNGSSKRKVRYL